MGIRGATSGTGKRSATKRKSVQVAVNGFCLTTYGAAYTGGTPRCLMLPSGPLWIVPVVFTSTGIGRVADVGIVALEAETLKILDATPRSEVRAAGVRLAREKGDVLEAAFRRARAT
jgi:hypothetical protein